VRFKFLLGEVHLASWRPLLQRLAPPADRSDCWPSLDDVQPGALLPEAAGYQCRYTMSNRFPVGVSRFGPWVCYVPRRETLYFIDVRGSFEDYLGRRSSKSRSNLKRSLKKLQNRNPEGLLKIADTPGDMAGFLREAAAISRQTYQSRLLQSGLSDSPETLAAMEDRARRGLARGYLLYDQGQPIAFAWCSGEGESLTYDVIGYIEETAPLSPGTVLLYLIVEDLFRLGRFRVFDFGVGEAPYKKFFSTGSLEFVDACLFRPTASHRLLVLLHWHLERIMSRVGGSLERAGLKARVKRLMRAMRSGA
jgi:hypothetical protein